MFSIPLRGLYDIAEELPALFCGPLIVTLIHRNRVPLLPLAKEIIDNSAFSISIEYATPLRLFIPSGRYITPIIHIITQKPRKQAREIALLGNCRFVSKD